MTHAPTRRTVLAGTASLAAGLAGCAGVGGRSEPISVLAAGSLQNALTNGLRDAVDADLTVEAYGSRHAAQLVAEGQRDPDILVLADVELFESVLSTPWYAAFASNALAVAYNPDTEAGRRVPEADRWYEPLLSPSFRLGRTDPDLDPLGYRTLLALELASKYYDEPDLRTRVISRKQVYPETQLLAQFETGGLDAAVVYRNMAVERDYPYVELPAAVNLSAPSLADRYATATVTLDDGTTVTGSPIAYGATLRTDRSAARSVFETLVASTDDYLTDHGFVLRDAHPTYHGNVPDRINN
ncbi:extracellular solute-binding protein [Halorientalis salina]|uniref:extracellular solute-binding protein n=1 Tax=Halorientalis salina TaxID=2932266 RepID=UPI0010AD5513|nr:extracellular solute-binding protein [Halorientalis salina]